MFWKLRVFWYHADKAALAFGLFFAGVVGALVFAMSGVFDHRDFGQ